VNTTWGRKLGALMVVAGAVALSACSGSSGGTNSSGGGGETLTLSRFAGPWSDASVKVLEGFTKETGIKVRVDAIDYAQVQQKQILNMQGKTGGYDVVYVPENWYQQYVEAGYLSPLDDLLKEPGVAPQGFTTDEYVPAAMKITTIDGKVYGLPDSTQTDLLCYDKSKLQEAGLQPPETWADLLQVAKYFKEHGSGIAMPARQGTAIVDMLITLTRGNGGSLFDAGGKLDLTNPAVVQAADYLQQLMKYSLDGSTAWHYDETTKALQFGQAPVGVCLSGLASATEDPKLSKVAGKLGYEAMPHSKAVGGYLLTWNYSVAADSKHQKDAAKLVAWLTSKPAQAKMWSLYPGPLSLRNDMFDDPAQTAKYPWMPAVKAGLGNAATPPLSANAAKLFDALGAALNGNYVNHSSPEAALQKVQAQLQSEF
jgi:multiple sugar transport system substrate-binding protein